MGEEKAKAKEEEKDKKKEEKDKKEEKKPDVKDKESKEKEKKEVEKDSKKTDPKEKPKDGKEIDKPSEPKDPKNSITPQQKTPAEKEKKKEDEKPVRRKLKKGMVVKTVKHEFTIEKILGSGGFGEVYQVSMLETYSKERDQYAMKIEHNDDDKGKLNRLKIETLVLEEARQRRVHDSFAMLKDKGTTPKFRFIVMELVSHSLRDIHREMLNGKMPKHTATYLVMETLKAVTALHEVGFIHRDIKPHNFAIGRAPQNERKVYILDFGIARRYLDEKRVFIVPRTKVAYIGTLKYCSRACHLEKEQSIRDDLECWVYMCLEFFGDLEWQKMALGKDKSEVLKMKNKLIVAALEKAECRVQLLAPIIKSIEGMAFTDTIEKTTIRANVDQWWQDVLKVENMTDKSPLAWEGKAMPEKKSRETRKKESKAKIKKLEEELLKMIQNIDNDGEATEDKKEEARRAARDQHHRRSSDQRRRRSGRRRRTMDEEDDYDDDDDYDDEDGDSYDERDDRERGPRRRESSHKRGRYRDEDRRGGRRVDMRKRTSRLTMDDEPRDRRRSQLKKKNSRTKRNSSRRRSHHQRDDDSPPRDNGRGSGKRGGDNERIPSAEKIDEMDGDRKSSGKRGKERGEKPVEGSKERGASAEPSPSATPIESSDKDKKKKK